MNRNNGNNFCGEMGYPNQQMREDVSFVVPASKCGVCIYLITILIQCYY